MPNSISTLVMKTCKSYFRLEKRFCLIKTHHGTRLNIQTSTSAWAADDGVFKEAIQPYQDALDKSGYEHQLKYDPPSNTNNRNRKRSRKITWFNPPFSQNVSSNVGAKFLQLIDTCFPPTHPLSKIINRNTVKVSYRCMPNMGQVIARHNSKVVKQEQGQQPPPGCNCKRGPATCPVSGAFLTEGVVYEATVSRGDNKDDET